MIKIATVGNGFIKVGEALINLKAYKSIEKATFGRDEDPEGHSAFGITMTPMTPSNEDTENGVDGKFFITTYTFEEKEDYDTDFQTIIASLAE